MPRFYFGLVSADGGRSPDEYGTEFETLEQAYLDGCRAVLEMSFDMLRERCDPNGMRFEITDAGGRFVMDLPFAEVLKPGARSARAEEGRTALTRFRVQNEERKRLTAQLVEAVERTTSTLAATRKLLARSQAQMDAVLPGARSRG